MRKYCKRVVLVVLRHPTRFIFVFLFLISYLLIISVFWHWFEFFETNYMQKLKKILKNLSEACEGRVLVRELAILRRGAACKNVQRLHINIG